MPIASTIFMLAALLYCAGSSTDETSRPILTSCLNNSSLTLNCSVNCSYQKIIWNIGKSRSNRNNIYNINGIQNFIQTNTTNRRCTMDNTAPQVFGLIIDISVPNISSILPSITCVGVLGMDADFVFSANTVNLAILLIDKTSVNQSETSRPILTSHLNNSSLTLNCSVNCTYTKIIWNIGNSRSNRNDIYNINGIQTFIQTNTTNRHCTMDNTAPQVFELIIDISVPNISSILPSITCVGVLGMDDDFIFSANTVNLPEKPRVKPCPTTAKGPVTTNPVTSSVTSSYSLSQIPFIIVVCLILATISNNWCVVGS